MSVIRLYEQGRLLSQASMAGLWSTCGRALLLLFLLVCGSPLDAALGGLAFHRGRDLIAPFTSHRHLHPYYHQGQQLQYSSPYTSQQQQQQQQRPLRASHKHQIPASHSSRALLTSTSSKGPSSSLQQTLARLDLARRIRDGLMEYSRGTSASKKSTLSSSSTITTGSSHQLPKSSRRWTSHSHTQPFTSSERKKKRQGKGRGFFGIDNPDFVLRTLELKNAAARGTESPSAPTATSSMNSTTDDQVVARISLLNAERMRMRNRQRQRVRTKPARPPPGSPIMMSVDATIEDLRRLMEKQGR